MTRNRLRELNQQLRRSNEEKEELKRLLLLCQEAMDPTKMHPESLRYKFIRVQVNLYLNKKP